MARPKKCRRIEFIPKNTYFIPTGKRRCKIQETKLQLEELEAMRLKDIEGLNQEECAERMQVSRQTFQNIIDSARKKVAIALTNGNAINISGGDYTTHHCRFKCLKCGENYHIKYEQDRQKCPHCGSNEVLCIKKMDSCNKMCHQ
ncbi:MULTISPECIES: DUF134 domain-containing protein [Clostridium]|uniref:DUF134 domain-containing protein n=1 Tax=Clostridium TaxID=1485 RepID=UPI0004DA6876|nr:MULTISPECIES: DUF134 domain-containing protein [Clostridium]KEI15298.1 hypothetical protein Z958_00225 [Clostridium novyi B str. NCTC 9691]OOB76406.1 hypothetical protein AXF41_02880 [Clostridium haemolyticum]